MGPLVYCFEGADNGGDVISLSVDPSEKVKAEEFDSELLGGTRRLIAKGYRREPQTGLYSCSAPKKTPCEIYAVPYCLWGNRGENQMRVWMDIC